MSFPINVRENPPLGGIAHLENILQSLGDLSNGFPFPLDQWVILRKRMSVLGN